jgi:hypothetical protein
MGRPKGARNKNGITRFVPGQTAHKRRPHPGIFRFNKSPNIDACTFRVRIVTCAAIRPGNQKSSLCATLGVISAPIRLLFQQPQLPTSSRLPSEDLLMGEDAKERTRVRLAGCYSAFMTKQSMLCWRSAWHACAALRASNPAKRARYSLRLSLLIGLVTCVAPATTDGAFACTSANMRSDSTAVAYAPI